MDTIYFNELSYKKEIENIEYELISVIKFLKAQGINTCKFTKNDRNVFLNLKRDNKILALTFFKIPFETSNDISANEDIEYALNEWLFDEIKTIGFSYAVNTKSFVLSFYNNGFDNSRYNVHRNNENKEVLNVSNNKNFGTINDYLAINKDIELVESEFSFEEKLSKSKFASDHHHGTCDLEQYLHHILRIPYVDYVINSAPLKKNAKFVSYDQAKNAIIVRMIWVDGNPGFVIKSTGRSERECKKIAEYLSQNLPKYKQENYN